MRGGVVTEGRENYLPVNLTQACPPPSSLRLHAFRLGTCPQVKLPRLDPVTRNLVLNPHAHPPPPGPSRRQSRLLQRDPFRPLAIGQPQGLESEMLFATVEPSKSQA